jgi:hypothetical protein
MRKATAITKKSEPNKISILIITLIQIMIISSQADFKNCLKSVRKKNRLSKMFLRSVETTSLGFFIFQVPGRACDYAGHCWLAVSRRKSNRIVAQQKTFPWRHLNTSCAKIDLIFAIRLPFIKK